MEGYNFFPCPSDLQFSFERNEEFERMPDTYPGPSHRREFVEQSASTSTSPSTGIIEASTSVASFNQKDRQGKRKRSTIYGLNLKPWGDLDQGRFGKRAVFKRGLRLLRLKADTSRLKTCWHCANNVKNTSLFCWERNAKFHKNPKFVEIIIRRRSILAQQFEREFSFIFIFSRGRWVIDWRMRQSMKFWLEDTSSMRPPPKIGNCKLFCQYLARKNK